MFEFTKKANTIIWHKQLRRGLDRIDECVDYYEDIYTDAEKVLKPRGKLIDVSYELPGVHEYFFAKLQDLEAILEIIEIRYEEAQSKAYIKTQQNSKIALKTTEISKYVMADPMVVELAFVKSDIAHLRNKYLGLLKSIEQLSYALGYVTKLRVAGLEDATIG